MADAEARFVIDIDPAPGKAGAGQMSSALSKLKAQIEQGTKSLQDLVAAAGRLKGSADVQAFERIGKDLQKAQNEAGKLADKVKALKDAGGSAAKIAAGEKLLEAARGRVSSLSAAQEKLAGTEAVKAYKDVTAAIGAKQKALAAAQLEVTRLGGSIRGTDENAKKLAKTGDAIREKFVTGMKWAVAGAVAGAVAFAGFAAYSADSARSAQILREAATGSAAGAAALEGRVNAVLGKTAATRAEVEGLALELRRSERFAGELDGALGAITTTSQVMGQQAGGIIKGLAERAVTARRFILNPLDLRGSGLSFEAVAKQLGQQMGIATGAAAAALKNGQVKIQDGLKALDAAVETRFGALAKKQMLALPAQLARAKDNLIQLFTGVGMEKFLQGLQSILGWLDQSSATGQKLRGIMEKMFGGIGAIAQRVFPMILEFFFGLVIGALQIYAALRPVGRAIAEWLGMSEETGLSRALFLGKVAAAALAAGLVVMGARGVIAGYQMVAALGPVGLTVAAIAAAVAAVIAAIDQAQKLAKNWDSGVFWRQVKSDLGIMSEAERDAALFTIKPPEAGDAIKGAQTAGKQLGAGLISGMESQMSSVEAAGGALASAAERGFNTAAEIHSPSALFRRQARHIPEGAVLGVEDGTPRVSSAVAAMASPAPLEGAARGGRAAGNVYIDLDVNIAGNVDPSKIDKQGILEVLVDVLEDACAQVGLPRATVT